jgi:hypothetical protein
MTPFFWSSRSMTGKILGGIYADLALKRDLGLAIKQTVFKRDLGA